MHICASPCLGEAIPRGEKTDHHTLRANLGSVSDDPNKLLIGQISVVLAIVLFGVWAGTQFAASRLGYQPELGTPWFELLGFKIFQPWQPFAWWYHFGAYAPHVFDRAGEIAATGGLLGCGSAVAGSVWRARQAHNVVTYGSARWANQHVPKVFSDC